MLGCLAVVFMFLAASSVKQYNVTSAGTTYQVTYCRGPQIAHWFSERCADALYPRMALLTLGLAIFLVCLYLATARGAGDRTRAASPDTARTQKVSTTDPGWKTCPDCAEGVRSTANVCPLCNFRFDAVEAAPPEDPDDATPDPDDTVSP